MQTKNRKKNYVQLAKSSLNEAQVLTDYCIYLFDETPELKRFEKRLHTINSKLLDLYYDVQKIQKLHKEQG